LPAWGIVNPSGDSAPGVCGLTRRRASRPAGGLTIRRGLTTKIDKPARDQREGAGLWSWRNSRRRALGPLGPLDRGLRGGRCSLNLDLAVFRPEVDGCRMSLFMETIPRGEERAKTRSAKIAQRRDLPDGEYGFLEFYCDEPGCGLPAGDDQRVAGPETGRARSGPYQLRLGKSGF